MASAMFDQAHPKITESTLSFPEYVPACQKSVHSIFSVSETQSIQPDSFLTMTTPKIFNQLLICIKLYQHAKNQLIPLIHSWVTVSFRVQRPDWPYPMICVWTQQIIKIFITEQIQWKLMTRFFFKFKSKTIFDLILTHFPNFRGKKSFSNNRDVMHNFIRVFGTMSEFREI